jgi:hypothetical protein
MLSSLLDAFNRPRSSSVQSTVRLAIHSPGKITAPKPQVAGGGRSCARRTYLAWCLAAVSLPVLAGYLFDMTRAYGPAVLIAAGANVAGMAMALTMPRHGWGEGG